MKKQNNNFFTSDVALDFSRRFGQNRNEYGENILHIIVSRGRKSFSLNDIKKALSEGWDIEEKDNSGNSVIDAAIDARNESALLFLLNESMSHDCAVHAIGELFSNYNHVGSSNLDALIFSLILKIDSLNKQDCKKLLQRACDGAAWPYLLPLFSIARPSWSFFHDALYMYEKREIYGKVIYKYITAVPLKSETTLRID